MKNNFIILYIFFFGVPLLMAQGSVEKIIRGNVISDSNLIEGVNVINTSSKVMSVSDSYGNFSILVREGDILSFSAVNYESLRKIINKQQFDIGIITVKLTSNSIELKEVVINMNSSISAENLGIIPRNQIKLTAAERKLATASYSEMNPMGLDPLLNKISGRTKMLKKALVVEKKEFLMAKLEYLFENKYYIKTLKIPEEQIRYFQYYCVEDADFGNAINAKNKTMCMFLITALASDFNKAQIQEH